jgi:hypothetical protein
VTRLTGGIGRDLCLVMERRSASGQARPWQVSGTARKINGRRVRRVFSSYRFAMASYKGMTRGMARSRFLARSALKG